MQNFHRFIASRQKSSSSLSNQFSIGNQQNKQSINNEDEKYIMEDESEEQQKSDVSGENNEENDNDNDKQDSVDPLDAFMSNLECQVATQKTNTAIKNLGQQQKGFKKQKYDKFQKNQQFEGQFNQDSIDSEQRPAISNYDRLNVNDQEERNYGEICQNYDENEGNIQFGNNKAKKIIETLKPFDFSTVDLQDFEKDFYDQHSQIQQMIQAEVKQYRKQLDIKVTGEDVPKPIISFGHLQLDNNIKQVIIRQQFQKPTPIQSQALPIALKGRDLIGVAKTGSGKTLAYVWPMITHVGHQRQSKKGQGPVGLVLAPTRQLCQQIFVETKKYTKKFDMKIACLLGGQNKHEQWKQLKSGVDILIASPGRLIQMIKKKATNLTRVSFLVLDEADKMLSLGFEQQIRSIVSQTRPDRQTLLFTATMKKAIQFLAYDILDSAIRVLVGSEQAANQNVQQQVVVVDQDEQKIQWLKMNIVDFILEGKVLIFCNHKESCQQLAEMLSSQLSVSALTIHGSKSQYERTTVMNSFKSESSCNVLIATDIASRGIDVKNIKTVINYQCPSTIQPYIHRIGRAGRAGQTGTAYSLLKRSQANVKFAIQLVKVFENSGYPVSKDLQDLACLDQFYRRKRISSKMGVSFAKGKDASKFLNQILKQQQKGNSKAGLGMSENLALNKKYRKSKLSWSQNDNEEQNNKNEAEKSIAEILKEKNLCSDNMSISQLSKIIKQIRQQKAQKTLSSSKLRSHFVKFSQTQNSQEKDQAKNPQKNDEVTISFYKRPQ